MLDLHCFHLRLKTGCREECDYTNFRKGGDEAGEIRYLLKVSRQLEALRLQSEIPAHPWSSQHIEGTRNTLVLHASLWACLPSQPLAEAKNCEELGLEAQLLALLWHSHTLSGKGKWLSLCRAWMMPSQEVRNVSYKKREASLRWAFSSHALLS